MCTVELTAESEPSTNGTVQLELFPNAGQLDSYPVDMFSLLSTFRASVGIIFILLNFSNQHFFIPNSSAPNQAIRALMWHMRGPDNRATGHFRWPEQVPFWLRANFAFLTCQSDNDTMSKTNH